MVRRLSKLVLVAACALQLILVTFNNLVDYGANFQFVSHVLSMDTVFPENLDTARDLDAPWQHHVFYALIIGWEGLTGCLLAWGAVRMARHLRSPAAEFRQATEVATAGLTVSLLLWFFAFMIVGGEWFLMWQSETWNGLNAALRNFTVHGLVLLYLNQPE